MSDYNDGGPAFAHGNPEQGGHPGMTLRDYFAINESDIASIFDYLYGDEPKPNEDELFGQLARLRYKMADAMLRAREES